MDTIDSNVLENAAWAIAALNPTRTGVIHTVTITLDGHSGGALVTAQCEQNGEITLVIK